MAITPSIKKENEPSISERNPLLWASLSNKPKETQYYGKYAELITEII